MIKKIVLLFLIFTSVSTTSVIADISERDMRLIRVAFINGIATSFRLSEDEYLKYKKDTSQLIKFAHKKANHYLSYVRSTN